MDRWIRHPVESLLGSGSLYIGDGYRAKNEELGSEGLPFARAGNIDCGFRLQAADRFPRENLARVGMKISQPFDVVFTSKGTVGRFAFVREDTEQFVYSPQLCFWRVRDTTTISPRFLFYWMHGREFRTQYVGVAEQTDMAAYVSLTDQRRMRITLPPIGEQRAIACVLGTLDDKIELNHRMNETLEQLASTLFRSWFVDFDPVRAKAEGRQPFGMDAETAAMFPDSFEETALGGRPKGWRNATVEEIAAVNSWTLGARDALETLEYVEISEVSRGVIGQMPVYSRSEAPSRARRRLRHGDTVLSTVRPDRGAYFLALNPPPNRIASTGFAVVSPSEVPWSFLHAALTLPEVFSYLGHVADGGAYPAVNPSVIGRMTLAVPPPQVLSAFHSIVSPLYERMDVNRRENNVLAETRDTLLPKLLSGELRVRDAEQVVEAVV